MGQLTTVLAIGGHLPHLTATTFVAQIGNAATLLDPGGLALLEVVTRQLGARFAIGRDDEEFAVAAVLLYAVVGHALGNLFTRGRYADVANAAHSPKRFGRELTVA